MTMDVIMPQLGETVSEGTVSVWHAKIGDEVSTKTPLFDVSSDKVEMEVPAPAEGTLLEIRVAAGTTVPVGEVVAIIGKEGEEVGVKAEAAPSEEAISAPAPAAAPARRKPPTGIPTAIRCRRRCAVWWRRTISTPRPLPVPAPAGASRRKTCSPISPAAGQGRRAPYRRPRRCRSAARPRSSRSAISAG
jgi:2-oxoglutarate dehydrogenase E2 component (dihydrolipoamide succinyltransferase)